MATRFLQVVITGDAASAQRAFAQLEGGLTGIGTRLDKAGKSMQRVGTTLTRRVTVPVLAAGGAAVKMKLDFEDAFTRISAISPVAQRDIARWKDEVLELSGRTAQAPQELAEALFFLASAGLRNNQIMPTLEASAQAAASGLGHVSDIAKIAANAVNAYADSNLTAKDALDVLVAAVREGSAEPDEFATALGRILPIASQAKIEFDEVAASLATVSNIGLDVNEGVTAMRGLLQALVAPGTQAAKTMRKVGITADEMRRVIAERGLLAALRLLEDRTDGNIDTMRKIVPNIRALTGAFGLTVQESRKVNRIFDSVANSSGSLRRAFEETAEGPAFQFRQRLNQLRVAAIKLGNRLLPIAERVIDVVGDLARGFSRLSPATQDAIIKFSLLAAALGPVLRLFGGILRIAGDVVKGIRKIAGAAAGAGTAAAAAGGAGGFGRLLLALGRFAGPAGIAAAVVGGAVAIGRKLGELMGAVGSWAEAADKFAARLREGFRAGELSVSDLERAVADFNARMKEVGEDVRISVEEILAFEKGSKGSVRQVRHLQRVLDELGHEMADSARATLENFLRVGDWTSAIKLLRRQLRDAMRGTRNMADSQSRAAETAADAEQRTKAFNAELKRVPRRIPPVKIDADTSAAVAAVKAFESFVGSRNPELRIHARFVGEGAGAARGVQHGFHGTVTGPRLFFVEPGVTERVDIDKPGRHDGGDGAAVVAFPDELRVRIVDWERGIGRASMRYARREVWRRRG